MDRPFKIPESVLVVIHTPERNVLLINRADAPDYWQSVTGSKDEVGEELSQTAGREVFEETGIPCGPGTVLHAGRQPQHDAVIVARLRAAGGLLMGKTVTTELATYAPGKTRNPHDPSRTPGGSSSGSAAAVAAGMVPLAIGTQTNGSVIRPASFCGVVGYKPTAGWIPRTGVLRQSPALDQVGVFARNVEDAALLVEALCGWDVRDPSTAPRRKPTLLEATLAQTDRPPRPLTVVGKAAPARWQPGRFREKEDYDRSETERAYHRGQRLAGGEHLLIPGGLRPHGRCRAGR